MTTCWDWCYPVYNSSALLIILAVGALWDIKRRSIPDFLWIAGVVVAALLMIFDYGGVEWYNVILSIMIAWAIGLALFVFGRAGLGDLLVVLVIGLVFPYSYTNFIVFPVVGVVMFSGVSMAVGMLVLKLSVKGFAIRSYRIPYVLHLFFGFLIYSVVSVMSI